VNTAVALQEAHGRVVLVDFAPIGHAALQLNLRPQFTIIDALQNLHRMDGSLLDGLMTPYRNGLHLWRALSNRTTGSRPHRNWLASSICW